MTTVSINEPRSLKTMQRTLSRLGDRMRELGLALAVYDAQAHIVGAFEPVGKFCRAVHDHCDFCEKEMSALAANVILRGKSATSDLLPGCCLVGSPVFRRRRLLGAVIAAFPVREMLEGSLLSDLGGRVGLDGEELRRLAEDDIRHSRRQADDFLHVLEWMLELEQAVDVAQDEIGNISTNLATTYEELSLVYRISGQMEVTQSPKEFFGNVCRELQEGMGIAAAAAVIYADRAFADESPVVIAGSIDVNEQQIRLIASTQIAPALDGNQAMVSNKFVPSAASGVGSAIKNLIAAPLSAGKAAPGRTPLMGMLIGFNKAGSDPAADQTGFDSIDLKLINSIANQGSVFLANNRLYAELQELLMGVLHALTASIDAKDPYTCGHSQRVALLSVRVAKAAGYPPEKVRQVYLSGLLHDVGKIGIPEAVLCKPGKLTDSEYDIIKRHPTIGSKILSGIRHLDEVVGGILTHHERPDGKGYPQGLRGEEIPIDGRIIGLADVFDAMTSDRTYRKALSLAKAIAEIRLYAGKQFDAELAEVFLSLDLEQVLEEVRAVSGVVLPTDLIGELQR